MNLYPSGTRIAGRYEVAGCPLIGGMGIVYLCYDHQEQRPVVLKTFKPEYLPDREARDRFLREGDTWIKLGHHPHIVRVYQVVRIGDGTEVYLVLELVAKEQGRVDASLRSWLTPGKPMPTEQVLLFAMQVIRGMQHANAIIPGFVHRDLKPENLLIGSDKLTNADINRLRVSDFGISRVVESPIVRSRDEGTTDPGQFQFTRGAGTPLYMAPEQWRGEQVSVATDIYALGCIVFEMLAGECMVDGKSLTALHAAHCESKHKSLPARVPTNLCRWVKRCVATSPSDRYASWQDVESGMDEVYRVVTGQPLPSVEPVEAIGHAERIEAGWSNNAIGWSYLDIGKTEVAIEYLERARTIGAKEGERRLEGAGLGNLGMVYIQLGNARHAMGYFEQHLTISREIGDRYGEGNALTNLGEAYRLLGNAHHAVGCHEQALVTIREIGNWGGAAHALGKSGQRIHGS